MQLHQLRDWHGRFMEALGHDVSRATARIFSQARTLSVWRSTVMLELVVESPLTSLSADASEVARRSQRADIVSLRIGSPQPQAEMYAHRASPPRHYSPPRTYAAPPHIVAPAPTEYMAPPEPSHRYENAYRVRLGTLLSRFVLCSIRAHYMSVSAADHTRRSVRRRLRGRDPSARSYRSRYCQQEAQTGRVGPPRPPLRFWSSRCDVARSVSPRTSCSPFRRAIAAPHADIGAIDTQGQKPPEVENELRRLRRIRQEYQTAIASQVGATRGSGSGVWHS